MMTMMTVVYAQDDNPDVTIHVVQRGENLFRIALAYGLTADDIAQANGIANPSNIQVGQRLIIPLEGQFIQPEQPLEHIVQPGENLSGIANLYGLTPETLAANNDLLNPNALFIGQVLIIAVPEAEANTIDGGIVETISPVPSDVIHTIQAGETLFTIATQYGTTVEDIQALNNIANANTILTGQQLVIPAGEGTVSAVDLPAPLTGLNLAPLVLVEGQSGRLRLTTDIPAQVTGRFLDRDLIAFAEGNGTIHTVMIPVPVATATDIYTMSLTITPADGTQATSVTLNIQVVSGNYWIEPLTIPDDDVPLLAAAVEDNEINILTTTASTVTPERFFNGPFSLPAAGLMNSPFGVTRTYNGGIASRVHSGADFASPPGAATRAAAPGRVVLSDTLNIRGNTVMIDHGWGVFTAYAHLSERLVSVGQIVNTGDIVGTVGSTGRSTGAHLHWELWLNGVPVDPLQWTRQSFP